MSFVTLEEVKAALRIEQDDDDTTLQLYIAGADAAISKYLKIETGDDYDPYVDVASQDIKVAALMLIGIWFKNPDGDPDKLWQPGYLPAPVQAILYPYRKPTAV